MRVIFAGDAMGLSGVKAIKTHLPDLRKNLKIDFVIVNGENAAGGFGITPEICQEFFAVGVDCITTGNHAWDKREVMSYIDKEPRLLRPLNYPAATTPGRGAMIYQTVGMQKVMVVNVMGRLFMDPLDDPFTITMNEVQKNRLKFGVDFILVDVHAEASSEKMAMGHYLDGKVSAVVGTHTHIPTADSHILPLGTGYQTDAGMCGDYNSIIGIKKDGPIQRFVRRISPGRPEPAEGEGTFCAIFIETDDKTGLCTRIEPIRIGPYLSNQVPSV